MNNVICVIPARGGSQRIPRKNVKDFYGYPIIAYSIKKAQESGLFDHIIVSTDDDEIALIAEGYGAKVHRRAEWAGADDVGTQEVVRECLMAIGADNEDDIACCIYATAPLMDVQDLLMGLSLLEWIHYGKTTFAFSVGYPPLQDAGQFYWGWAKDFIDETPLINPYTRMVHVAPERICDINTHADWMEALRKFAELQK